MLLFASCGFFPSLRNLQTKCDGIELRLDLFPHIDFAQLRTFMRTSSMPIMFTLRRKDQGGGFVGLESERFALMRQLVRMHPTWLDLEWDVPNGIRREFLSISPKLKLVSSFHDGKKTPQDLTSLFLEMQRGIAHSYKIATYARSSLDALRLLLFAKERQSHSITCIGMGEQGRMTRVLSPVVGNAFGFAPVFADRTTAEGQIPIDELYFLFRVSVLNAHTYVFALIGYPVSESLGERLHNDSFAAQNINAVYVKFDLFPEELPEALALMRKIPFAGLSVTMPLKQAILPYVEKFSTEAKRAHAVNTISFCHDKICGYNTDGIGARKAIAKHLMLVGKRVVLLGAGGAANAIAVVLGCAGASILVHNRDVNKANALAERVEGRGAMLSRWHHEYDVLINCLPKTVDVALEWFAEGKYVMDCTYVPKVTPFLTHALQKKCTPIYGYEMFLQQALAQEQIWFPKLLDLKKTETLMQSNLLSQLSR